VHVHCRVICTEKWKNEEKMMIFGDELQSTQIIPTSTHPAVLPVIEKLQLERVKAKVDNRQKKERRRSTHKAKMYGTGKLQPFKSIARVPPTNCHASASLFPPSHVVPSANILPARTTHMQKRRNTNPVTTSLPVFP
jgi:hypothetical protein